MANSDQVDVRITLHRDARPIQGLMRVDGHSESRFHGWLELNDRLEQALSPASAAATVTPPIDSRTDARADSTSKQHGGSNYEQTGN